MSDHPEIPRVEFNDDGESMNIEGAVERFRRLLQEHETMLHGGVETQHSFNLEVVVRACDCESDINGRDEHCPLHGNPEGNCNGYHTDLQYDADHYDGWLDPCTNCAEERNR